MFAGLPVFSAPGLPLSMLLIRQGRTAGHPRHGKTIARTLAASGLQEKRLSEARAKLSKKPLLLDAFRIM
jgi:vacuolar-type H+-ATPase subunit B/Vma2